MSKLDNLVRSKGYKNFMAKLYGIGAAIVILGAMFKIMHWPGADLMIVVGMSTEAIIFLFSAIEPLHVEYDWSLVYPELAGMDHGEAELHSDEEGEEGVEEGSEHIVTHHSGRRGGAVMQMSDPMTQQLDKMLEDAKNGVILDGFPRTIEQAEEYIKNVKRQYHDAKHNVFAYAIETGDRRNSNKI